jgi:hypothetical protein
VIKANFHGSDGPVNLSPPSFGPLTKYYLQAAEELGYPIVDQNAPYQEGKSTLRLLYSIAVMITVSFSLRRVFCV